MRARHYDDLLRRGLSGRPRYVVAPELLRIIRRLWPAPNSTAWIASPSAPLSPFRPSLKRLFPEMARELRERRQFQLRLRSWKRLLGIGRKLRILRVRQESEKLACNPDNVLGRARIMIRKGEPEERLFLWVKQRPME